MPRAEFKLTRPNRLAGGKDASTLIYFLEHKDSSTVCDVPFSYSFFFGDEYFNSLYEEVLVQEAALQCSGLSLFFLAHGPSPIDRYNESPVPNGSLLCKDKQT